LVDLATCLEKRPSLSRATNVL